MSIEEGLLTTIIEKLRTELQGMIRYELSRGLDKPEANQWVLQSPGPFPFSTFLTSTLSNTLYPKETTKVSDYLHQTLNMMQKFKFFKEIGQFFLPADNFLTQTFMTDICSGQKILISNSELQFEPDQLSDLKPISHLALTVPSISSYLPSNFTKSHHDSEFTSKIILSIDPKSALDLISKHKLLTELSSFKLPKIQYKFNFTKPSLLDHQPLWDSVSSVLANLEEIKEKIQGLENNLKAESENKRIVNELVSKNYNEEVFDQLLEISN